MRYYRSVNSLATWKTGKEKLSIPSEHRDDYIRNMTQGNGFPSLWLPHTSEDLEKIALGILLRKGHLDNIHLVGFDKVCFGDIGIELNQVDDLDFPIPTVSKFHYELSTRDENKIQEAVQIFMKCNGKFDKFFRAKPGTNNMKLVAAKYLNEVSEQYRKKAEEWAESYRN